jgi:hypothetical protein
MSWEDRGRDEDGRFGHGTAPPKIIGPRIDAIACSAVANLPRGDRHRESASFDPQGRQRLRTATTTAPTTARTARASWRIADHARPKNSTEPSMPRRRMQNFSDRWSWWPSGSVIWCGTGN